MFATMLSAALLLVTLRVAQPDVAVEVREFTIGMAGVVAALVAGEFLGKVLLRRGSERRRALLTLPGVIAVLGGIAAAYVLAIGPAGPGSWAVVAWGAAVMLVIGTGVGVWKLGVAHRAARR